MCTSPAHAWTQTCDSTTDCESSSLNCLPKASGCWNKSTSLKVALGVTTLTYTCTAMPTDNHYTRHAQVATSSFPVMIDRELRKCWLWHHRGRDTTLLYSSLHISSPPVSSWSLNSSMWGEEVKYKREMSGGGDFESTTICQAPHFLFPVHTHAHTHSLMHCAMGFSIIL